MKNTVTVKVLGIIALAVVIGFSMTGCPTEDDGDNGGGGSAFLGGGDGGPVAVTSGEQVYLMNGTQFSVKYDKFNGNLTIQPDSYNGVTSGKIENGKLTYTLGTPSDLWDIEEELNDWRFEDYDNVTADKTGVKYHTLWGFNIQGSNDYDLVSKNSYNVSGNESSYSGSTESVDYWYVDADVTITGKGKTVTDTDTDDDGFTWTQTVTTKDINLALKKGWNAVYTKQQGSGKSTVTSSTGTWTETISLSNPALKWVLGNYDEVSYPEDDYDYSIKMNQRSVGDASAVPEKFRQKLSSRPFAFK